MELIEVVIVATVVAANHNQILAQGDYSTFSADVLHQFHFRSMRCRCRFAFNDIH